ncbi:NPCBM/NEW2 domain-containing protein [Deinococcus sp. YIM 77859]|uniref:NPCBM/NEW2 domain-containing protein n=1 Tax=Deinococcus sp. YIM 77859 TaxID=1540221 RepID=UPI001E2E514D|nr:NPCBM/NEW2 domain-containing protein [Deinococcus sp. YIM 77859]
MNLLQTQAIDPGDNTLSNEPWTAATNGWGPAERNRSNGEKGTGDGRTLTLNGKTYGNGFGVHSDSSLSFDVGGKCTSFTADIGVDDEVGSLGSVVFQVYADGVKLYDSGIMTGASTTKSVNVNIAGRRELKLVVTNAGDNIHYDHADWANAMLRDCVVTTTTAPSTPTSPIAYSGPITITRGGTYSGNWESLDPNVPAVSIKTAEPVVIENANIRGRGDLIRGYWVNLTVRNTNGYGLNPNVYGRHTGRFISAEDVLNLRVENNYLEGTTGIYVNIFQGKAANGQTVKILRNRVKNIDGRKSDGKGGYLNDRYLVQFVQLSKVRQLPEVEIAWNEVINEPGKSSLEENINLYSSSGTPESPIKIHNNYIQGAYAIFPATDSAYSGGGIMLGDGSQDNLNVAGGYVEVFRNQIVSTSNQGIGIAGGHHQNVYDNRVLSSGRLPDGSINLAQNVGLYVWDMFGAQASGIWSDNSVHDNLVGWARIRSDGSTWLNNTWFPNCTSLCYNNRPWPTAVTLDTERQEFELWRDKVRSAGLTIGPR